MDFRCLGPATLYPGSTTPARPGETVVMVPDDPGTWMYRCHVDEHMMAGMVALYKVVP